MEKKFAKFISVLFHPIFMPTVLLLLSLTINSYLSMVFTSKGKLLIILFSFVITTLLPASIILFLWQRKLFKKLEMEEAQERTIPLIITGIFYYLNYYFMKELNLPSLINSMFLGGTICIFLLVIINFYWKISAHLIGIGGVFGGLCGISSKTHADFFIWIAIILLLSGILGFARIQSEAHKPSQVYIGFLMGTALMWLSILFL